MKRWQILSLVLALLLTGLLVFYFAQQSETYITFIKRDQAYYSNVADACDVLRSRLLSGATNGWLRGDDPILPKLVRYSRPEFVIRGNDATLPAAIRKLRPDFVDISKSHVSISIPYLRGWGVLWAQSEADPSVMYLLAGGEGVSKTVFWRTNSGAVPK